MRRIYSFYCLGVIILIYIAFFPIQFILLQFQQTHFIAHEINHVILRIGFFLMGFSIDIEGKDKIDKKKNYVFVANHFSILDIPVMFFVVPRFGVFVGKDSLEKIPLFGYMYKRLYITVNRRDAESRNRVFDRGLKALRRGDNIVIFPEGTISKRAPELLNFKDGAFKIAQMADCEIVPVTIINNWKILPDRKPYTIKNLTFAAKIHPPIKPEGDDMKELRRVKEKAFEVIDAELKKRN